MVPLGRQSPWRSGVFSLVTVLLVSGALYSGYLFFATVRAVVARGASPLVDAIVPSDTVLGRAPEQELPNIANRRDRINILLLGIDKREGEAGPFRTDTMILASIDPATNSASMMSIPRDLWVTIPGFGENRINTAHFMGDSRDYPGGGVALAKKTVWHAFGVPVHYYVRIDFVGFERIVDAIGGLTVNVEQEIYDTEYPDENYGTMVIHIPKGIQPMDGKTALQFARSRHSSSDFDRMARQLALIMAARDKALSLDIPLSRIPVLIELAGESIQTDMKIDEIIALAEIVRHIERGNIREGIISDSMTTSVTTPQGWMVEIPNWDEIRPLVDELFPTSSALSPTPSITRVQIANEEARIALQNGTLVDHLAQDVAVELRERGFNVIRYDNADRFDYAETQIVVYTDKHFTLEGLITELNVSSDNIHMRLGERQDVDILAILGRDADQRLRAR